MDNIVLVGFMAVGKTTIGKNIAKLLNRKFVDTDRAVIKKAGMSINEIFKNKGEEYFRELEYITILELCGKSNLVISTGGGAYTFKRIRKELKNRDFVVNIETSFEDIYERVNRNAKRPKASEKSKVELRALYDLRINKYRKADSTIFVKNGTVEASSRKIIEKYNKWKEERR